MKKISIASVAIALFLSLTGIASAAASTTREEVRNEIKTTAANIRNEIKQKRQEFKSEIKKKFEKAAENRLNKNLSNMSDALSKIIGINARIETRIAKLTADGKDVASSTLALSTAKTAAATAKTAISDARVKVTAAIALPTIDINLIKEYVKSAEETLKAARFATAKAISTLKGFGEPANSERTSGQASTTETH